MNTFKKLGLMTWLVIEVLLVLLGINSAVAWTHEVFDVKWLLAIKPALWLLALYLCVTLQGDDRYKLSKMAVGNTDGVGPRGKL